MRIGIVAPSTPILPDDAEAVRALASLGYPGVELEFDPQCFAVHGHFAGEDGHRFAALVEMANRPDIDAIWFARGGYGACRIAEDAVAAMTPVARGKAFLGYSDQGNLLGALYRDGFDHVAHGPMVADIRREGGDAAVLRALDWLVARDPAACEPGLQHGARHAAFNLMTLSMLLGTPLEPDLTGHILLIEEVSEYLYAFDRALFHVASYLAPRGLAGLRLGRVSDVPENDRPFGVEVEEIAQGWCARTGINWLGRADIGHDADNKVVPFGLHRAGRRYKGRVMRAFIFPGQGSQAVGMGKALADASPVAREVFQEVDDALGQKLFQLMSEGPEDQLTLTENAQPAIMANAIATLRVLEKEGGVTLSAKADYVAGHSLGEYSALCAAGAFDLATAARLLKTRGQAMQAGVPVGVGAMAALLGADIETAQKLADAAAEGEVCTVANDNDPSQVVISGHKGAVERAVALVKDYGIKRGILLPVSAPFHCPLMQPAADAMAEALGANPPAAPLIPVVANVTASPVSDAAAIRDLLVQQITGRVRWRESVGAMEDIGVTHFVEFGGKVLSPMVKRSASGEVETASVISMDDIEALLKTL